MNLKILFRQLPVWYVSTAIVISTLLGMAAHNLITQLISPPPNNLMQSLGPYYSLALFFIHALQGLAAMILYALISRHWQIKKYWMKIAVFALLLAILNENFLRRFIMDIVADHRYIAYEFFLVAIPAYLSFIFVAWIIVIFFSLQKKNFWTHALAFVLVTFAYQYIEPASHSLLTDYFPLNPGGQFTESAYYDPYLLITIYATYLLPVTGMLITYLWIRESLPERGRGLLYALLLIGVHGQFFGIFKIATSNGFILTRILYYGSFWLELLVVAFIIVFFVEKKFKRKSC